MAAVSFVCRCRTVWHFGEKGVRRDEVLTAADPFCNKRRNSNFDDFQSTGMGSSRVGKMTHFGEAEGRRCRGFDAGAADVSVVRIETRGDVHLKNRSFLLINEMNRGLQMPPDVGVQSRTQNGIYPVLLMDH